MSQPTHQHAHAPDPHADTPHRHTHAVPRRSVLAWPAWLRVLAVLPVVLTLWLAVAWANMGLAAW